MCKVIVDLYKRKNERKKYRKSYVSLWLQFSRRKKHTIHDSFIDFPHFPFDFLAISVYVSITENPKQNKTNSKQIRENTEEKSKHGKFMSLKKMLRCKNYGKPIECEHSCNMWPKGADHSIECSFYRILVSTNTGFVESSFHWTVIS